MRNTVILIPGRNSNMQAIINAGIPDVRIVTVLSNSATTAGLAWTTERGIPTDSLNRRDFPPRSAFDQAMMEEVGAHQLDLVILAGFMHILTPEFCTRYGGRLMGIHPSILPSFTGLRAHEHTLATGCRMAGCTIYFVIPEPDCGPIISQGVTPIFDNDTADDIAVQVLKVEHRLFPQTIANFATGRLKTESN